MERLDDLQAFLAVVEKGSQAAASRHLRRSLQSVNRSLLALESAVGVELVKRSTRKSEPTAAGRAFYERIQPAFVEILQARNEAASAREEISGLLRIGAPVLFASSYVGPAVCDFLSLYSRVEVELKASDEQVDLFDEGLDLTVRIGESIDESLIARRVNSMRVVTFGAESYFAKHGRPRRPQNLAEHNCIVRADQGIFDEWPFCIEGDFQAVSVSGSLRTNSAAVIRTAASEGIGLARLPFWQIRDLIEQKTVEIVLAEFEAERMPIQLLWQPTRVPLQRTRRFADLLAARLKAELF
jgi:DNA-binding transcriptional LysR family regulator